MTKSLMWLLDAVLAEASTRCSTDTHRDYLTVSRRTKHEGLSFLTIALPKFARDFERGLERGSVDSTLFLGYRRRGCLPAFLRGFTSQVFDPGGRLLDLPSEEAILCIRQICLMFKKVNLPCSEQRTRRAFDGFRQVEYELRDSARVIPEPLFSGYRKISRVLWSEVLGRSCEKAGTHALLPKHGPGATAEGISGNAKYRILKWHQRLEEFFPFAANGLPLAAANEGVEHYERVEFVEPGAEDPVRVISVPKTLSAPRIIAIEPVCMQYIQQALAETIVHSIEQHPLTAGHVNFHDQQVNRKLAFDSSKSGTHATLDLSDASDRVHRDLVHDMLESVPDLRDAIFACRSTRANLGEQETLVLNKFASMGSALCFPMESMVFFTILVLSSLSVSNRPPTRRNIERAAKGIYVYGDDLIIPVDEVEAANFHLKAFGLKVNTHKSFGIGKFRESCGMDAYDGVDVTPVYVRHLPPVSRRCASETISFVSLANLLYQRGWWATARRVREYVESIFGSMPHVLETSPCLGWISFSKRYSVHKWCTATHSFKVKGYVVRPQERSDPLEGYAALMKFFLKRGNDPIFGRHLERTVRPRSASIRYGWASPH